MVDGPLKQLGIITLALALVTVALLPVRSALHHTHVALAYLLLALVVSSRLGRVAGLSVSVAAFLCFNFFFVEPYYTLTVADPLNWVVLGAFLVTSLVAAQLLARARAEATAAEQRAREVEHLSMLGAETLNAGRAEDALHAIAEVIRATLFAGRCEIHIRDPATGATSLAAASGGEAVDDGVRAFGQPGTRQLLEWSAAHGRAAISLRDGSMRVGADNAAGRTLRSIDTTNARVLVVPLHVGQHTVGVLSVVLDRAFLLNTSEHRFLEALAYYAALGVDRARLVEDAERAEALRKADEMKDALLASVSHDLRTPLTTIKALAHEIREDGDDRAVTIEEEADRLNRFVADLLDLSRIAGRALHPTPEINAAEDLVGAVVQRVAGSVRDHELVASLDTGEPLLLGRFDFVYSLRVLVNLVENAVKFAPPRSRIEVHARRANGALEFSVADRGPGVTPPRRDRIFEPFYQGDGAPDVTGAGLGLSIARGLAESQGGSLRYEPRQDGGSVFVFSVPAADVEDVTGSGQESL